MHLHLHIRVHFSLFLMHLEFAHCFVQLHLISRWKTSFAKGSVIQIGTSFPSSTCQPYCSGSSSGITSKNADAQMLDWYTLRFKCNIKESLVGGILSTSFVRRQKESILTRSTLLLLLCPVVDRPSLSYSVHTKSCAASQIDGDVWNSELVTVENLSKTDGSLMLYRHLKYSSISPISCTSSFYHEKTMLVDK